MLIFVCEDAGYPVTSVETLDDALMVLRTSLHPLITIVEGHYRFRGTFNAFFEHIRDHPNWYGQHRYIALASPSSDDEEALLHTLNVALLPHPFPIDKLVDLIAHAAAALS